MKQKSHFAILVMLTLQSVLYGQIDHWTTVSFGNLQCEFPSAYKPIDFTGAGGVYYDGGNVYLTVTGLPDTSSMKGNLDRDYTRDFMNVVLEISRKLNGRVREFRDTVIANMPGYISKMEISFEDGRKSNYELLQILQRDTMLGFSGQYYIGDKEGTDAAQRFLHSVKPIGTKISTNGVGKYGVWIGGIVLVLVAGFAYSRLRRN